MNPVTKVNDEPPFKEPGLIVLTLEEAKEILQSSYNLLSWANCPCIQEDKALEIQSYLKERIEQAEKDNASN